VEVSTVGEHLGDGSLGTVEVGPGEAIQIRSLNAITGDVAFLGIPNENGIRMAVEDYGQIGGHDVDLGTGMDDLCSADGGQAAAQTIVADQDVLGVIGTSCSGAATAASPLISEAGMVMISGSNTSPALTSDLAGTAGKNYNPGYYRTAHNDLYQGAAAANFALDVLGVTTAAAIHDGDPYTEGLATAFADAFASGGGTVTGFTAVNKGDSDMVPVLTEVAAGSPEMLFFPIFQPEGDFIVQQASTVSGLENTIMMAADGLLNSNFLAVAETQGMFFSGPDVRYGSNYNQSTGETAADVLADYKAEFGEAPAAPFWAHSYDAAALLMDAIAAASYEDGGALIIDRAGVREHLNGVTDYSGLIGTMACDAYGDCSSSKITVIQNIDTADYEASTANVVYEYAPLGATQVGDIAAGIVGTIRLGAAVSETGKYAREGEDVRQGYNTWLDWVNNEYGGININGDRYAVELVMYDDESNPDTAANLIDKLINEDGVDFLLGPYSSGLTKATSAIAEQYGLIMVEANGASESVFARGFQNLFGVLTPASYYTQSGIKALADAGAKTMVVAYEDTAFPTSVLEGALHWAEVYDLEVLGVETYPKDVADVSGIMTKFRDLDPDIFVGGGHFNDALLFVNAAEELGFAPDGMIITVGPSNPDFYNEIGDRANTIIGPTQWEASMAWEDPYFGTAGEFTARYEAMWGESPTYQAAESAAAPLVLMMAIEAAASTDTDAVRDALRNMDAMTFYGPIKFDETGKNIAKPMGAIQVQGGEILVIAPAGAAVADLIYPAPDWNNRGPAEPVGTIRLGAAVSETGKYAREGEDVRQGYNTWLDWVNNEYGGININGDRYAVELVMYDDESNPDTAANLIDKLINEDGVDFLLGPYSSGLTKATSAIAEQYGLIMVEANGASESVFARGFQNLFGVLTPASYYTQSGIKALADAGAKTMVVAYEDTAFPTSVLEGALHWAEVYDLEVLGVETYPKDVADVSGIMTKFRDLDPDIFVGGGHFNDALLFVNAAEELGFAPDGMIITVGPSNPDFYNEIGDRANTIIGPTQWEASMAWEDPYFGTAGEFTARYEAMWGESPTYQAAESAAAPLVLMMAIEAAASTDTDAVRDALRNMDAMTFYGPIKFDETGKNIAKPMGAIQVQGGEILVIAPAGAAVADLIYPAPDWNNR